MKRALLVLGLLFIMAGVCSAELVLDISGSQYETQSPDTVRIRNVVAPGYPGKYWVDFKWDGNQLVFVPLNVGAEAVAKAFPIGTWNDGPDGVSVTISQLVVNGGAYGVNQFLGSVTFLGETIAITRVTDPNNYIQGYCFYPSCGDERTDTYFAVLAEDFTNLTTGGGITISLNTGASNTQMTGSVYIIQMNGYVYQNDNAIFTLQ